MPDPVTFPWNSLVKITVYNIINTLHESQCQSQYYEAWLQFV